MLATRMRMAAAGVMGTPAAGWWVVAGKTCVAAYQPIGAASLAASYTNLANPGTYDAAPGVAPTWASGTGWTGNGSSMYLSTGIYGTANYTYIIRVANVTDSLSHPMGHFNTNQRLSLTPNFSFTVRWGWGNSAVDALSTAPAMTSGVLAINAVAGYRNGVSDKSTASNPWTGTMASPLVMLARTRSDASAVDSYYNGSLLAVAIYSDTLSGAEVATVSAAMAALT